MKIIHIVGRSKNGKTTLILEVIAELRKRSLAVGTLKHSGHAHELETPGKDSWRHRKAGAVPSAVATTDQMAVYLPRKPDENPFDRLGHLFAECDIVLVEGYANGPGKNIEVWRAANGKDPLFPERDDILAVVTDDPVETGLPVWPRNNVAAIVDAMMRL
ncbi:MAG: molybdopterin-guanine dinucleotide biosynthesis protein B [Thermodesulfobacteriota bacterium]|nr:molybdopterin-guanine dinucleotide biosynthesis protein B [Thermodesulfobacteriota bacterium]